MCDDAHDEVNRKQNNVREGNKTSRLLAIEFLERKVEAVIAELKVEM